MLNINDQVPLQGREKPYKTYSYLWIYGKAERRRERGIKEEKIWSEEHSPIFIRNVISSFLRHTQILSFHCLLIC